MLTQEPPKKKSKRNYIMNQFTAHHTYTEKERKSVRTGKNEWILRSCIKFDKHNQMKSSTYHTQKMCKDFICFSTVSNFYISLLCCFFFQRCFAYALLCDTSISVSPIYVLHIKYERPP